MASSVQFLVLLIAVYACSAAPNKPCDESSKESHPHLEPPYEPQPPNPSRQFYYPFGAGAFSEGYLGEGLAGLQVESLDQVRGRYPGWGWGRGRGHYSGVQLENVPVVEWENVPVVEWESVPVVEWETVQVEGLDNFGGRFGGRWGGPGGRRGPFGGRRYGYGGPRQGNNDGEYRGYIDGEYRGHNDGEYRGRNDGDYKGSHDGHKGSHEGHKGSH